MSSIEDRIAAVIHGWTCGMKHRVDDRARCCVTARAVVAELGLTEERRETITEHHMIQDLTSNEVMLWPSPPVVEQRIVGPWRSVSFKEQPE